MWRKFLQWVMDNRPATCIKVEGNPLFFRAFLCALGPWRLYLHHFVRSDPDRGLHDHPAWNVAFILSGGYWEQRLVAVTHDGLESRLKRMRPGMINVIDEFCFHRVILEPHMRTSWSLFLVNYPMAKGKRWGFLRWGKDTKGGWRATYTLADPPSGVLWWKTAVKGRYLDKLTGDLL